MKKWIVGVYRRFSADELLGKEESNSVANQKKMIDLFLLDKKDIKVYKYYVDDGYTGTDFNRPGYKEMMEDIKNKKINGIIVKDLSRLGRNYIEVGNFIDEIIPKYKLRFISVNDNVDSYKDPNIMSSLEIPFKNLMNESYSRDSSKKLRSSLKASKKAGNFIGKYAPYGYLKDENDCHKLKIDNEAAIIIRQIFDMALRGYSKQQIIKELNNNHILTPSMYMIHRLNYDLAISSKTWNTKVIDYILKNATYTGSLIQGKKTRISHKTHNIVSVAEEEWIKYPNHHEEIVSEEIFLQVQDLLYNRNLRINNQGNFNKYTGYLKCPECGSNLYKSTRTKKGVKQVFYYCGTYMKTKKCNKHYILEKELDAIVIATLNSFIELVCDVNDKISEVISVPNIEYEKEMNKIKLIEIEKEIDKYKRLLKEVSEDYKCDFISKDDFDDFNSNYLYELNKLQIEKDNIVNSKVKTKDLNWLEKFKATNKINEIDRNIVEQFIENIYVNNDKTVEIRLKYKDQYEDAIMYLKNQKNMI